MSEQTGSAGGGLRLEFDILELRTRHPFHISRQHAPPARHSAWVRLIDADGVEGWGEAPAVPFYGETAATLEAILPRLAEVLTRASADDSLAIERIEAAVDATVGGHRGAKAAISAALHDLLGKRLGVPVWRLWGLSPAGPLSSFTIGMDDPETVRRKVREAAAFPILKLKVGGPRDEEVLAAVREEAPDKPLRVDANTAWTARQALAALPMLETFNVELLEQPVAPADLDGLRLLRRRSSMPIVADESCVTLHDIPRLAGVVDGINLKVAKCGGLRETLRMIHCARAHHLRVMLGCMVESTLAIAGAVQLAPLVDDLDLDGSLMLAEDPFTGPGMETDGRLRFNAGAGLGVARSAGVREDT